MVPTMCIYIEDKYFWGGGLLKYIQGKGWGVNKLETTPPCKECILSINIEKGKNSNRCLLYASKTRNA